MAEINPLEGSKNEVIALDVEGVGDVGMDEDAGLIERNYGRHKPFCFIFGRPMFTIPPDWKIPLSTFCCILMISAVTVLSAAESEHS